MVHTTAKVSEQVNRKCCPRNTILQFLTPILTLSPQSPHFFNHRHWCHLPNALKHSVNKRNPKFVISGIAIVSMLHGYYRQGSMSIKVVMKQGSLSFWGFTASDSIVKFNFLCSSGAKVISAEVPPIRSCSYSSRGMVSDRNYAISCGRRGQLCRQPAVGHHTACGRTLPRGRWIAARGGQQHGQRVDTCKAEPSEYYCRLWQC